MELLLRQPSIKAKRFTLVFDHIDDAPTVEDSLWLIYRPRRPGSEIAKETCNAIATSDKGREPCHRNKVRLDRKGAIFKSYVLQHFHSGVVYPLFKQHHSQKSSCIWISFISLKAYPCAFIVKDMLDHHFFGSDAFDVSHIHGCLFRTIVASNSIKAKILLTSPIKLPGITFILSDSLLSTQTQISANSNYQKLKPQS
jgi:hypothetical protein